MKSKKIEQILKRNKTIILYHGPDDIQFLSDGTALYSMFNLPKLTKESIFTMFDIPEKKASKFLFKIGALSQTFDVNVKDIARDYVHKHAIFGAIRGHRNRI